MTMTKRCQKSICRKYRRATIQLVLKLHGSGYNDRELAELTGLSHVTIKNIRDGGELQLFLQRKVKSLLDSRYSCVVCGRYIEHNERRLVVRDYQLHGQNQIGRVCSNCFTWDKTDQLIVTKGIKTNPAEKGRKVLYQLFCLFC